MLLLLYLFAIEGTCNDKNCHLQINLHGWNMRVVSRIFGGKFVGIFVHLLSSRRVHAMYELSVGQNEHIVNQ